MGREIRRVPEGWEHPKDYRGYYDPLYDGSYSQESQRWLEEFDLWRVGEHSDQIRARRWVEEGKFTEEDLETYNHERFWERDMPPNEYEMRPDWEAEGIAVDHYQVYETVSEGTPVSPVFATLEEVKNWLMEQGYSEDAASNFLEVGSVPSMFISYNPQTGVDIKDGIEGWPRD